MPQRPGVMLGADGQPLEVRLNPTPSPRPDGPELHVSCTCIPRRPQLVQVEKAGDEAWAGVAAIDRGDDAGGR
jgi:hypothetical protein